MLKTFFPRLPLFLLVILAAVAASTPSGSDWPDWRGPGRDGVSQEKNLPVKWSPQGENLAWRVPYGGRSTPVVLGNRVYLQNTVGKGETLQERVMCFDADSGKKLWEYSFNVYLSDVPPHRVGWASPVGDPGSGNIYVYGVGGNPCSHRPTGASCCGSDRLARTLAWLPRTADARYRLSSKGTW